MPAPDRGVFAETGGVLTPRTLELGLICRADDRDEAIIQLSPPLIADRDILGELLGILDQVLTEAGAIIS